MDARLDNVSEALGPYGKCGSPGMYGDCGRLALEIGVMTCRACWFMGGRFWAGRDECALGGGLCRARLTGLEGWKGGKGWGLMGFECAGIGVRPRRGVGSSSYLLGRDLGVKSSGAFGVLEALGVVSIASGVEPGDWDLLESETSGRLGIAENNRVEERIDEAMEEETGAELRLEEDAGVADDVDTGTSSAELTFTSVDEDSLA